MLADASPVDEIITGKQLSVNGFEIDVVSLAGHSPNQLGFLVDGVFFCADIVLPESVVEKYRIPYLFSVTDHLKSLAMCSEVERTIAMPGHGAPFESIEPIRDLNLALVHEVVKKALEFAVEWITADAILTRLLRHFGASANDAPSFYLLHPTAYAFLSYLLDRGKMMHEVRDGESLWRSV